MKIAVGSDHRGFEAKKRIVLLLEQLGHETLDMGTNGPDSVDYPDLPFR
jgi:ribose 5-phosphate isomerase B